MTPGPASRIVSELAEEESYSDRTADRHHRELALRKPTLEFRRTLARIRHGGCGKHRGPAGSASSTDLEQCHGAPSRTRESPRGCCSGESMHGRRAAADVEAEMLHQLRGAYMCPSRIPMPWSDMVLVTCALVKHQEG